MTGGLKKGMSDLRLLDVLTSGESAFDGTGETSQQILQMFDRVQDQIAFEKCNTVVGGGPSVKVEKCGYGYALLRHDRRSYNAIDISRWIFQAHIDQAEYYLAGKSDEGRYFVRPLGSNISNNELESTRAALDWLNREDQGFWRLQGDLVVKFMPYRNNRLAVPAKKNTFIYRLGLAGTGAVEEMAAKNSDFSRPIRYRSRYDDIWPNEWIFGNHLLHVYGWQHDVLAVSAAFAGQVIEPTIVEGDELDIAHPEHAPVYTKIPRSHYAILMSQRGGRPIVRQRGRRRVAMGD